METAGLDPILEEDTKKLGVGVCSYYKSWIWRDSEDVVEVENEKI